MVDPGPALQAAAERHMALVWEAFYAEEEGQQDVPSPASAPFCGCETCVIREVLAGAWPYVEEHFAMLGHEG